MVQSTGLIGMVTGLDWRTLPFRSTVRSVNCGSDPLATTKSISLVVDSLYFEVEHLYKLHHSGLNYNQKIFKIPYLGSKHWTNQSSLDWPKSCHGVSGAWNFGKSRRNLSVSMDGPSKFGLWTSAELAISLSAHEPKRQW
jgi:hypothetical protein